VGKSDLQSPFPPLTHFALRAFFSATRGAFEAQYMLPFSAVRGSREIYQQESCPLSIPQPEAAYFDRKYRITPAPSNFFYLPISIFFLLYIW
jgi:hypothetical protein